MNNGDNTAIFSTDIGVIALNGSVKIKILDFLKTGCKSFDEIVQHTGKAKSTISVHLNDLKSQNLLEEAIDSKDKRKKVYYLRCQYVACSQEPGMKHYNEMLDLISSPDVHSFGCLKCLFHAIQYGFRAHGVNCDPIMRKIGNDIGNSLSNNITSQEPASILQEMLNFWENNDIGSFTILEDDPIKLAVNNFFDCRSIPIKEKTLCSFAQGVLEGVFRAKMGKECVMQMVCKCDDTCDHCIFQMIKL
ncbi:ArsR family transcriptional regulator [Methanolobus vulcani]|uniref:ArsR family transcriptional regulator n=1 Tax=Methanolobus vulcani TaxID=38026 RepID=A0A7Z8KQ51_9EURY|nr:ArsR family transcriptional regulator [Methanolobus vulcani]TQD24412.1 ArsR family transcriptional regulator [Methanolobus vulcani]